MYLCTALRPVFCKSVAFRRKLYVRAPHNPCIASDGRSREAAQDAANAGISVYTVGIGDTTTGARIPTTLYGQPSFITFEGEEVWSLMNPEELERVARAGGGAFVPAGTANLDLGSIYAQRIASDAGKSFDSVKLEQFIPRFQWFAIPALLIILGDSWMSLRPKNKRSARTYEVIS